MKPLLPLLACLVCSGSLKAQSPPANDSLLKASVRTQLDTMGAALVRKDFNRYFSYMHPAILRRNGGLAKARIQLQQELSSMENNKSFIQSVKGEAPREIIDSAGVLQCILQQSISVTQQDVTQKLKAPQIALSYNRGKKWFFIDGSRMDRAALKKLVPQLSARLVLPKTETKTTTGNG
jgi:hypothetical protein